MKRKLQHSARNGRRKPYTQRGIARLCCYRCKVRPAVHQWNVCSDGNRWRPICIECDIALNALALSFFKVPDAKRKLVRYIARIAAGIVQASDAPQR